MNKHDKEVHKYQVRTILAEGSDDLSDYEADFIMATKMTLDHGHTITDKQEAFIERLYERITR